MKLNNLHKLILIFITLSFCFAINAENNKKSIVITKWLEADSTLLVKIDSIVIKKPGTSSGEEKAVKKAKKIALKNGADIINVLHAIEPYGDDESDFILFVEFYKYKNPEDIGKIETHNDFTKKSLSKRRKIRIKKYTKKSVKMMYCLLTFFIAAPLVLGDAFAD